ncbi:2-oxoglutarate-dependent dioxygenase htyE isoform X1 [Drosophila subpulchrella]|uniref:2-oxoglutarate-dependent dioxygenase htyE isoform X1 n=1 Tax=Drosophila subpulchrella TaxID=1486046 RepID=UPI0018A134CB|nr:2-oxoglutarate-dependent dioxygenase htyE isoform X1 [Drosophila subpulchrella]
MESNIDTLLSRNAVSIIDLGSSIDNVAKNIRKALSEQGYALLINHEISNEKIKTSWEYFDRFVELPKEVKLSYERSKAPDAENHGYVSPGMERFDGRTPELRHAYNICKLQDAFLPEKELPGITNHINSLTDDFNALGRFILQALALSLDAPPSFFLDKHSYMLSDDRFNLTTLRMLYYPPVADEDHGNIIRCGAHADYCTFTLLAQDSEGGLEVKLRGSDKWERVGHLPGALFINCGETMAVWTDQLYHVQHRVVVPDEVDSRQRGRHSIAFFCHPDNSTLIDPKELKIPVMGTATHEIYNAYDISMALAKGAYGHNYS